MAEGGVTPRADLAKLKPVPPPKPSCSPGRNSEESCNTRRISEVISLSSTCGFQDDGTSHSQSVGGALNEESGKCQVLNVKHHPKTNKPPLLPKPTTILPQDLSTRLTTNENRVKLNLKHETEKLPRKSSLSGTKAKVQNSNFDIIRSGLPSKIFIPVVTKEEQHKDVKNDHSPLNLSISQLRKAPVAKLDEFDNLCDPVNPIRPPRSPKNKNFVGGPFAEYNTEKPILPTKKRELLVHHRGEKGIEISDSDRGKYISLGKSDDFYLSDIHTKSCSLGRGTVSKFKHLIENHDNSAHIKCTPIPPPRRRRKSTMDSSQFQEITSFQRIVSVFDLEYNPQSSYAPLYAQVNYNLKKNRRLELQSNNSDSQTQDVSVQTLENCSESVLENDGVEYNNSSVKTVSGDRLHDETNFSDVASAGKKQMNAVDSENDHILQSSESNNLPSESHEDEICCDTVFIKEDKVIDNLDTESISGKDKPQEQSGQSVLISECSDFCTDCLSTHILEHICDDSLSSSKLDWQSVKSSLHSTSTNSSNSNIALESDYTNCNGDDEFQSDTVLDVKCNATHIEKCDEQCETHQHSKVKTGDTQHDVYINIPSSLPIKSHSDMAISTANVCNKNYKRYTSSLPANCRSSKRVSRRQSWSNSRDNSTSLNQECVEWEKCKAPGWIDEGELSSGILADLDSSDNAALEDIDVRGKNDNASYVGKKIASWWGSFGKGHKHRDCKRLSQFYCKDDRSFEINTKTSKNTCVHDEHLSSVLVSSPIVSTEVEKSVEGGVTTDVSTEGGNGNTDYKSETHVSKDTFEIEHRSDSEVEDNNSIHDTRHSLSEGHQNEKKAFLIAQELMTSERVFISVLKLLNVNFKEAIEKAGLDEGHPVISDIDLCRIINILPQLQEFNEDLLRDLEQRIENWSSFCKIADVVVRKGPFLKLYTTYIQNFEAQCNYFDECCQKYQKFAKVVKDFEASPVCQKLSIKHFMLKPIQRIPQYRLLLDDYSRHLDPHSPDYEDTQTALRIVSDVADHANRSIKLGDHLSKLLQLQSLLGNYEIIRPGRVVLKDGELWKLSRKDRQPRYFILLNDCLLYTSYYGSGLASGLKVNSELPLSGMKVTTPQSEDYHNEFSIISSTRSFTLSTRSLSERQEWVHVLQTAIKEYTSRQLSFLNQKCSPEKSGGHSEPFNLGKEAPVWIQDGRVTKCQSCIAEFTVTFRRHHCRACGKVVCGVCSEFRAPLQYMKFQAARVCEECYNALLKEFENVSNASGELQGHLLQRKYDQESIENIRSHFKKLGPSSGKRNRKYVPQRLLEVSANDTGSQMSGWLQRRMKRSWKRFWFVLKEQVLYVYKASEDVVALETIPVLGYKVEPMKEMHFQLYEGIDAKFVFQLAHPGQLPLVFSADSENLANRWISAMQEATVLK